MSLWSRFMYASKAAYTAFKEDYFTTDPLKMIDDDFNSWPARRLRYALNWSYYEGNAYRIIHKWAKRYKVDYGLYEYIRSIYNPAYRDGEFWKIHLWGGRLDQNAGADVKTAIPIGTDNDNIRSYLADIWRWSNWSIQKDIVTLKGSVFGDYGIMAVDDTEKERVYLKYINPGTIQDVTFDAYGNVRDYCIVEDRRNPNGTDTVTYREEAYRDGVNVVYKTFMNNVPYAWNGEAVEWSEPYGFTPLVIGQHNNVGLDWGWGEMHAVLGEVREIDDLASKLSDQIRKAIGNPQYIAGASKGSTSVLSVPHTTNEPGTTAYQQSPQPGREETPIIYGPAGSQPYSLVGSLDIASTSSYIKDILGDIEEKLPELRVSRKDSETSGEKSGRAIREARRESTGKVEQRRTGYDDALVRVQKMALSIGGMRGYFQGLNEDSYEAGLLDHEILPRPIFDDDPLDEWEIFGQEFAIAEYPTITKWRKVLQSQGVTNEAEIQKRIDMMIEDAQANDGYGFADINDEVSQ